MGRPLVVSHGTVRGIGTASHAKYIGCADRLGERGVALRPCAVSDRFFLDPDLHFGFPRRCNVGHTVCDRLRILHLLSAQPAAADIVEESASSCGSSRFAPAQFAVGIRPVCAKFGDAFMRNLLVNFQRNLGNAGSV